MKKLLMIAIAAFALMACGEQNKYDAALDEYENLVGQMVESIKSGDMKNAEDLDRQLTDLGPIIKEIDEKGTAEQKSRKQELAFKLLKAMFSSAADTTQMKSQLKEAGEELNQSFEQMGKELGEGLDKAANEIKDALDKAFQ
ncbi:MAG: hypothetical protein IJT90_04010 [Bacteroidaceae bacterium]|nr:hypothetical protein [Bacteroidaceae bacterium]